MFKFTVILLDIILLIYLPALGMNLMQEDVAHPHSFLLNLDSLTNSVMLTSCPPPISFPLPLFILLHHCPSSATYLILFIDSLQPFTLLFLKEKELKLAGEMNNVSAINSGVEVSVFSCVCVWGEWGDDSVEWTPVLLFMLPSNFCTDCRKGEMISAWRFSSTACGD